MNDGKNKTVIWLRLGGIAVLALLGLADLLFPPYPYFGIDGVFGFNAWFGFAAVTVIAIAALAAGALLKRDDDYYDRRGPEGGDDA